MTTLMLLVVAVLLAAVVTYYATNITMTRTELEEICFSKEHVWVNGTGAIAGFKLQNLGGRDVLLDKITVEASNQPGQMYSFIGYPRVQRFPMT